MAFEAAITNRERVLEALVSQGNNPCPKITPDAEWAEELEGFAHYGPLESWTLQHWENEVEKLVEFWPEELLSEED